jgi:hypothetical protein
MMNISVRSVLQAAIVFAGDSKLFLGKCVDYSPDRHDSLPRSCIQ